MDPEITRKINQVKIRMMDLDSGSVFFSALLSFLKIKIDPTMDTAWTNGIEIGLNPDLVLKATIRELEGVFIHELGHVIYQHIEIGKEHELDPRLHNIAGDHYINLELARNGYILPHWIEPYADKKYTGWSTMKIYNDLVTNPPPPCPKNSMGIDIRQPENDDGSPMDAATAKEKVINNIVKATMAAEAANEAGSIPGHVKRYVEEVTSPKLPWHMILANYMSAYSRDDYSMARPNRRYMPDFYLPSLYSEGMGPMIIAQDVSGSISHEELAIAGTESKYIFDTLHPTTLRYISFDTHIHFNEVFQADDEIPIGLELEGGGGTNVIPVLDYVRLEDPQLCLIFTDGHFSPPDLSQCTGDLFWIIKGNKNFAAPQGTIIHMDDD